ncbi:MAG TPA: Fur family transcriptional regulator [Acidimicrobiales bacterium]
MTAEVHTTAATYLHRVGQRYTTSRRSLVDVLLAAGRPLTLPDILDASPGLAQSSAYRNLGVLEQAGVVHRIPAPGEFARYELVEELTGHHHHLVCTQCGAVDDVAMPPRLERALERTLHEVADAAGFDLAGHRLDLVGRCPRCSSASRRGA